MKSPAHFVISALLTLPIAFITPVTVAETSHNHDHASHETMELNQGQKWETDAPLRQGMSALHQAVSTGLADAHANTLRADGYRKVAKELMTQFTYIVENCNLAPEADAQLHILLANILQGVEVIEGKVTSERPEVGLVKIAQALNNYGSYFDHPNWKDIEITH